MASSSASPRTVPPAVSPTKPVRFPAKPVPVMLLSFLSLSAIVAALWLREAHRENRLADRTRDRLAPARAIVPDARDIMVA